MEIDNIADTLLQGGVALLPTDTVYGLLAAPEHQKAVAKIFALKRRPIEKALPVFVADLAQLVALGAKISKNVKRLLRSKHIPGPLTLVLELEPGKAPRWLGNRAEVAVRFPNDPFLLALLRATGPLLATSANASGLDTPAEIAKILTQLHGVPDITLDGGPRTGTASTLINCRTTPFSVIRKGALLPNELAEILAA